MRNRPNARHEYIVTRAITTPMVPPVFPPISWPTAWNTCSINSGGAIHEACCTSCTIPSVGFDDVRNGAETTSPMPAAMPMWVAATRRLRSGAALATTYTINSTSGTAADTFTSAPSVSTAVAGSSRFVATRYAAAATDSMTRASTWPPPRVWKSTTGFSPMNATAYAVFEGLTCWTSLATNHTEPSMAPMASARNAKMVWVREWNMDVMAAATHTNTAP